METFQIQNLSFTYPLREKPALENIDLTVKYGEFVTLCGKSGCGKSTLLRNLKTTLAPHGKRTGSIRFYHRELSTVDQREQASRIGYVLQNPENQLVTDKVWHELAFGLESLGYDSRTIRLRVAEMASFFGIQNLFLRNISELSGGQKQVVNLASIMAMQPDVLILDEPTSQLDPIAADEFLETIRKINREIGTTILMTEHRLDAVLPMSDRVVVMDQGRILLDGPPSQVGEELARRKSDLFSAMPAPMQIYAGLTGQGSEIDEHCPITVRDGRNWLTRLFAGKDIKSDRVEETEVEPQGDPVIQLKDVWFRYERNSDDVVKDLSMEVRKGELYSIVGGNGTGKSTTLSLISGINWAQRGRILIHGKELGTYKNKELFHGLLGALPQNPQSLFVEKTVALDLGDGQRQRRIGRFRRLGAAVARVRRTDREVGAVVVGVDAAVAATQRDDVAAEAGHLRLADADHRLAVAAQAAAYALALAHVGNRRQTDHRKIRPDRHHHIAVVDGTACRIHRVKHLAAIAQPRRQRLQQGRLATAGTAQPGAARGVIEHDGASAFQVLPMLLVRAQVQQRAANPLLLQPGHDVVATLQPAVGRRHRVQHQRAVSVGGKPVIGEQGVRRIRPRLGKHLHLHAGGTQGGHVAIKRLLRQQRVMGAGIRHRLLEVVAAQRLRVGKEAAGPHHQNL